MADETTETLPPRAQGLDGADPPDPPEDGLLPDDRPDDPFEAFLLALGTMANVRAACAAAHVGRATVYRRRVADDEFAKRWDAAIEEAVDRLEQEAWRRAVAGTQRIHYRRDGSVAYTEKLYSDRLLELLLKRHRPSEFRERVEVSRPPDDVDRMILDVAQQLEAMARQGIAAIVAGELGRGEEEPDDVEDAEVVEPETEPGPPADQNGSGPSSNGHGPPPSDG